MRSNLSNQFKILSYLLQFPDDRMLSDVSAYRDQIEEDFTTTDQAHVRALIDYLVQTPLLSIQEAYSATFDLNPDTCLNLTYHRFGDDRERGSALAKYAAAYIEAGFEPTSQELPDYLPMVLEFLSVSGNDDAQWMIFDHLDTISGLTERLDRQKSPYKGLFQILYRMLETDADATQRCENG